jgi:hypothetical protein
MKRTKLMVLESEFEKFYIQEGESLENMYSRLMHILNEIESFLSSLESPIHDSSSQKEIIERLKNKISEFELKVQSHESKL